MKFQKILLVLAAGVLTLPLRAQDISGTIEGTVLDPSGSTIADAKVTVTNTDRNQVLREITTGASGIYSAPLIPVGHYEVRVEASGFKAAVRKDIVLNVNDDIKLNLSLEVGARSERVEVQEQAAVVELGTVVNATTILASQVAGLPLASRNYEQLVSLVPGAVPNTTDEVFVGNSVPSGTSAQTPYAINGNRNSANNWTVDGADNVDRGANLTLMTFPSIDSIAEFKVERSMYTADTGRAGGGQISVITKNGTSQFHGDLYEFFRNDALNANNWINNANKVNVVDGVATVPPLRWNDFGGTIGGPIYIPGHYNKDRNKTFFFFSEEARRIITYTTFNPVLPTAGMIRGVFPTPVCLTNNSPCTQSATTVPASLINPIATQYIKDIFSKVPLDPASTSSEFFAERNVYNTRQEIVRADHTFSSKFSLWAKFENDSIPTTEPGGLFTGSTIPNGATTNTNSPGQAYVFHFLETLRPNVLNEAGFNYTHSAIDSTPLGLTAKANSPDINVPLPYVNTQGVVPTVGFTSGTSIIGYGPYHEKNKNWAGFDNFTFIHGRHELKFGIVVNRYNKTENAAKQQGSFSFTNTGAPSGTSAFNQSFANFLLGNVSTFTMPSTDITPNLWLWQTEAYAQDDYRITPHLTLYAGIRYSYFGLPTDSNGQLSSFDQKLYNPSAAPKIDPASGNIVAGSVTLPYTNGIIIGSKNSPFGSTVANNVWTAFAPRLGLAWDPTGTGTTSIRLGYGIYYDASAAGIYENPVFQNPPYVQSVTLSNGLFNNVTAGSAPGTISTVFAKGTPLPNHIPYVQQWSFDIQRQVGRNGILDIGYTGTKGTHLPGNVDINQAYPGAALAAGLHVANGNTIFTAADDPRINAVRPYLGYNAINVVESAFDSNYHALQTSYRRSFGETGVFQVSYTWGKNLTDSVNDSVAAPQNSYNFRGEYGPAQWDRKSVLALNYVYAVPLFKDTKNVLARDALKGWQTTGLVDAYTGSPFTVSTSNLDAAGVGLIGNSAAVARPDIICNPNDNAPHTVAEWFNTSCFVPTPQGQVRPGNAPRGIVRGPGFFNWDVAMMKDFDIRDKAKLQFRAEALNVLNWVNPNGFASTNITSTLFGQINSFRAPRRLQLALKVIF